MSLFDNDVLGEAIRLTRSGRVKDATAALRAALARQPATIVRQHHAGEAGATPVASVRPGALRSLVARMEANPDTRVASEQPADSIVNAPDSIRARSAPSFEMATYVSASGSLDYKLFVPRGYHGEPVPLVVMLHGCTQSPDDFAAGTRMNALAEERTFIVAYPLQPPSANASRCWNWFRSGDQRRGEGEPALIAGMTRRLIDDYAIDAAQVHIAGLSAGGAAAAIMGATYPDLYASIGVHSGLACGAAQNMAEAFGAMRHGGAFSSPSSRSRADAVAVRAIVFHGDRDATVSAINGDQVIAQAKASSRLREVKREGSERGLPYTVSVHVDDAGVAQLEHWVLHGAGHAWSGGSGEGSYTDARGPDASREMIRFFLDAPLRPRHAGAA